MTGTKSMKKNSLNIVVLITVATFIGKVLGVARDILISYYYGSTDVTDAFFMAMSIPTMILGIFTASTDSAIIPQYSRIKEKESKKEADKLFSYIINSLLLVCSLVSLAMFLFPQIFIKIFASGFKAGTITYSIDYLKIFAPLGALHMLYCFYCTYCAVYKQNWSRVILAFSTNLIVVCTLFIWHDSKLLALSIAYLISHMICAILPMLQVKKLGYKHTWSIDINNSEFKRYWKLFMPIMGGAFLNDIQQYVDKNLASGIYGGISTLNYASKLITIFDSIFVVGISVVLLPMLSELRIRKKQQEFRKVMTKVTKYLLISLVPCFVLLFGLADEWIAVIYGRGEFDKGAIHAVSIVLKTYSPLIVLVPLQTIFSRFFHALERNHVPFKLNLISVGLNVILSILLAYFMGLKGISLATTIATFIILFIYVRIIEKEIGWDAKEINIKLLIGMAAAISACCIGLLAIKNFIALRWFRIAVSVGLVAGSFFVLYFMTIKEDMKLLFNLVLKLRHRKNS